MKIFVFIVVLVCSIVNADTNEAKKRKGAEGLINSTSLVRLVGAFEIMVKGSIAKKKSVRTCSEDPDCLAYWDKIETSLLKDNTEIESKARLSAQDFIIKRYNEQQIEWLEKTLSNELYQHFIKSVDGDSNPDEFKGAIKIFNERWKSVAPFEKNLSAKKEK